ncbi:C/D box methylation guide ribonucleoprotein complex aNOP56 subunit [Candidatus Bathyarchaeota archaeon]|nr:C/D box methylation guide ribonucleoprotein complex aNOP56 subunit [Candidatus Bathyarchaeota archaeon]
MKAFIVPSVIGVLALDSEGKIIEKSLFPRKPVEIAERLERINSGETIDELETLIRRIRKKGYEVFVFEDPDLARSIHERLGVSCEVESPSSVAKFFRRNIEEYAVKMQFLKSSTELAKLIHDVSMEMSRTSVRKAAERRDFLIVQAVETLDDLDKTLNLFANRIREWYGLHFPELSRIINNHETYARLVRDLGERKNFSKENLRKISLPKEKINKVVKAAQTSMGADLRDDDIDKIQILCNQYMNLLAARRKIEGYLKEIMKEESPNLSAIAGPILGAKLIALAGGLENLAKMPSSTIQVLGAEKALFRSLRTGARPPKHGVLFQHVLVHGSRRSLRGKISRALAGKIAIAARTDIFSDVYIGDQLKKDLLEKVEEIKKKGSKQKTLRKKHREKGRKWA